MTSRRITPILPLLLALMLVAVMVQAPAALAAPSMAGIPPPPPDPLERRLARWPDWSLPAPLPRPGRDDLVWPAWFSGTWEVSSLPAEPTPEPAATLRWRARFVADGEGGAVADRAFNARQIGEALLGDQLLAVHNDPTNPNRQVARLRGDRELESTVVGRRRSSPDNRTFLADELTLQVLHGPTNPRISRVEVLGRWHRCADGSIRGEQWQASYASPAAGLPAQADHPESFRLRLVRLPPGSDPAS